VAHHANADVVRRYFTAVERDPTETSALYSPDVVLHYSGTHRLAGDHRGPTAIQELFQRSRDAFSGSQRLEVHDVLGSDDHGVALLAASAELDGRRVMWNRVVVFHISDGRITEQWILDGDQHLVDQIIGR
jgi:ketosteroid isomerase-like protein